MSAYEVEHNIPTTQQPEQPRRRPDLSTFFSTLDVVDTSGARQPQNAHALPLPRDISAAYRNLANAFSMMRGGSSVEPTDDTSSPQGQVDLLAQLVESLMQGAEHPPTEVQGVSDEFIEQLDRVPKKSLNAEQSCPICSNPFLEDSHPLVVRLPCHKDHIFDLECIQPWLKLNPTCPLDRKVLIKKKTPPPPPDEEDAHTDGDMSSYEGFVTADSFNIDNDQIINSTMNMPEHSGQFLPEYGSDGSADMSIELGRGARVRPHDNDMSSNLVFDLGNNSQYEITATPPVRPTNDLRRQASLRRATAASKSQGQSRLKHRSLSETLAKLDTEEEHQPTATFQPRNTRFVRSRQASANEAVLSAPSRFTGAADGTPRRAAAVNNPTVQSATYTANSFQLPDMADITELVRSPVVNRSMRSRSRFTSASYRALHTEHTTEHAEIESVPIPDEEHAIWKSLQMLKDKVAELQMDKAELLSQLQAEQRRPRSPLAAPEIGQALKTDKTKVLQTRLERAERKISTSDITIKRLAKERDQLAAHIQLALDNNDQLQVDIADLKDELAILRNAIHGIDRRPAPPKRLVSEPVAAEPTQRDSTIQLEMNRRRPSTNNIERRATPAKRREPTETLNLDLQEDEDDTQLDRDLTVLSDMNPDVLASLRRKIEQEHITRRQTPAMPRKSSLKDLTAGLENVDNRRLSLNDGEEEDDDEEHMLPAAPAIKVAKTVRLQSPHTSDAASIMPSQQHTVAGGDAGDTSMLSNTSRRRRQRAASASEGMTSAFILPDITLHASLPSTTNGACVHHQPSTCTACRPATEVEIPTPIPASQRVPQDVEDPTLRPAELPSLALATLIKNLEDEVKHLKLILQSHEQAYLRHDPSMGRRARLGIRAEIERVSVEVEKRSEQVYRLYDVLEGQRMQKSAEEAGGRVYGEETEELGFEGLSEEE
ncbi:hypothetical protein LTR08_002101 [Meristemomyces frigidus]|nr:hypothetical protein LTR08_002101 [Meristemomyces frigidus]